mgnify:CR=1 FL=1
MKNKLLLLLFVFLGLFTFSNNLFAAGTATVNGMAVTIIPDGSGVSIVPFNGYNLGTSNAYVYNDTGSSTALAGQYYVLPYRVKNIEINITNLKDAGTTTIGIFTANGTNSTWFASAEPTYSGTQSASFPILENSEFMRIGAKRSGDNAGSLTVKLLYLEE